MQDWNILRDGWGFKPGAVQSLRLRYRDGCNLCPIVMVALYGIGLTIIFLPCGFFLSIFLFFSSPNLSGRRLDVYHTSAHGVALVRI